VVKNNKILLLPLFALLLNSCFIGKNVPKEEARARVLKALANTKKISADTVVMEYKEEALADLTTFNSGETRQKIETKANIILQGKDLQTDNPELAISASGTSALTINKAKINNVVIDEHYYYTDEWEYRDYLFTFTEYQSKELTLKTTYSEKQKTAVDPLELQKIYPVSLLTLLPNLVIDFTTIDLDLDFTVAHFASRLGAGEIKGVLKVEYKLDKTDYLSLLINLATEGMTSEERKAFEAAALLKYKELVSTLKRVYYKITVEVNEDDIISALRVDLNIKQSNTHLKDVTPEAKSIIISKAYKEIRFVVNKPVVINYPDLTTYLT